MSVFTRAAIVFVTCTIFGTQWCWGEPIYASNKKNLCIPCGAYEFPFPKPAHGLVLVSGSILSPEVAWVSLNLDERQLSKVTAVRASGVPPWTIRKREDRIVSEGDLGPIIDLANNVWSLPALRDQRPPASDGWEELYLLDEADVRRETDVHLKEIANQIRPALEKLWVKYQQPASSK